VRAVRAGGEPAAHAHAAGAWARQDSGTDQLAQRQRRQGLRRISQQYVCARMGSCRDPRSTAAAEPYSVSSGSGRRLHPLSKARSSGAASSRGGDETHSFGAFCGGFLMVPDPALASRLNVVHISGQKVDRHGLSWGVRAGSGVTRWAFDPSSLPPPAAANWIVISSWPVRGLSVRPRPSAYRITSATAAPGAWSRLDSRLPLGGVGNVREDEAARSHGKAKAAATQFGVRTRRHEFWAGSSTWRTGRNAEAIHT